MLPRAIVIAVIACVAALLACVQFASDALYARAAPHTLVAHIPLAFGVRVYRAIDRIAPADYVDDALGADALQHGDPATATRYAVRMPPSPRRDDLLAQIAQAQGQEVLAREYYFAAADVEATQQAVMQLARTDIFGALRTETAFRDRLMALGTHPDAVAASYAISANLEMWLRRYAVAAALNRQALALAPHNMAYVLSAANDAYFAGDLDEARALFEDGLTVNPASGNCYAGLGLVALHQGDRAGALTNLHRARAVDPGAPMIAELEAALK